ncbi:MAG: hypothetical protein P4L50_27475 [Anaerolineaceae bacterium]|nr:hypothetical protein [Anaerolineaceae bacterium]
MTTPNVPEQQSSSERTYCGHHRRSRPLFWGTFLILLGAVIFLNNFVPFQHFGRYIFPVFLIVWGGYVLSGLVRSS